MGDFVKRSLFGSTMLAGAVALVASAAAGAAAAQTTGAGKENTSVEEVVVTGTRIRKTEYTSPSPVAVITAEKLEAEGTVDFTQALQESPLATTSPQQSQASVGFAVVNATITGSPGATTISLRGLGPTRTLVLLNGRRLAPSGVAGQLAGFNPNVLPTSIVQRVEILKDGASSIYGSDAVAGVVNIITKQAKDGGQLDVYYNQPFDKGGEQYRFSGSYGKTFQRGWFNAAAEYYEAKILHTGDRSYLGCAQDYMFDPNTHALADIIDPHTGSPKCFDNLNWGGVTLPNAAGQPSLPGFFQYDPTNAEGAYGSYASTGNPYYAQGWRRVGLTGNRDSYTLLRSNNAFFGDTRAAQAPTKRGTLFFTGGYQLTSDVEAYSEILLDHVQTDLPAILNLAPAVSALHPDNPFGRTANLTIYDRAVAKTGIDYTRAVAGLRGRISQGWLEGWDFDVYGQVGRSYGKYTGVSTLPDALTYTDGNPANGECGVNGVTVTPVSGRSCVGVVHWFSPQMLLTYPSLTPQQRAFFLYESHGATEYTQNAIEGSVSGEIFRLPAGPVSGAFGFHARWEKLDDEPDPRSLALTGFGAQPTRGGDATREAFAELDIPLLRDLPLIKQANLTVSGRYTDVHSYGANSTYKVGLNWTITPEYRLRVTYGTSFRAPAIYERVLPPGSTLGFTSGQADACLFYENSSNANLRKNCAAAGLPQGWNPPNPPFVLVRTAGNPDLKAETSDAFTAGVVWSPRFADLSVAVDYFRIQVDNEINRAFVYPNVKACYEADNYPNAPECGFFQRDQNPLSATYLRLINVLDPFVNISTQVNRGLDLSLRYHRDLGFVDMTFNTQATWIFEDYTWNGPGTAVNDRHGSLGYPDFGGNANVVLTRGPWSLFYGVQMIGKASLSEQAGGDLATSVRFTGPIYRKQFTEFTSYHDVSLTRRFSDLTVRVGIQNLFNELPPALTTGSTLFRRGVSALTPAYDVVGRRAFINLSKRF